MKRILTFISVFALLLTACQGDPGPPGFDGRDGLNGIDGETAIPFEITHTFNDLNNFEFIDDFQNYGITPFPSDVVLVYRLWENNAWRLLPQTVIFDDGNDLVYNFDFTETDFSIFLDSSLDLNTLGSEWTDNQIFRIILVPADALNGVDISELDNVLQLLNLQSL